MKVCITRNAEARTNAAISRIVNALEDRGNDICLLTRSRYSKRLGKVQKSNYKTMNNEFANYEIGLKSQVGKGISNIYQLIIFQAIQFVWLLNNKDKYDIIHAFDLDSGLPSLMVSKILKKKIVYHIADFYVDSRGGIPSSLRKLIRRLEFSIINSADITIICTEDRLKQIEGSKPKKIEVIHNTPVVSEGLIKQINEQKDYIKKGKKKLQFTYVGGLSENRFIISFIEVVKKYPSVKLNIAGMGKLEKYVEKSSEIYGNINYLGRIDYNNALKLYLDTEVMFAIYDPKVPNHKFSAPNKVYEAMMLGKPIIVAKGTGVDKIVVDNNMGIAIDYSQESFEKTLNFITDNPDIVLEWSKNSSMAYKKYSWDEMMNRIRNIYKNL